MSEEEKTLIERLSERAASIGARAGIEAFERAKRVANRDLTDRRLRNVKLLLRNYRAFKDHVDHAVAESSLDDINESALEILELMSDRASDGVVFVDSIKRSIARTRTIVEHIDVMLDLYKLYCERSPKPEEMRAYRCIYKLYLDRDTIPVPTPDEVAEEEGIDVRTLYRDIDRASERLAALIFGIDGMKKA
jgi:hypothetical protein